MLSPEKIRAARGLIGWTQQDLAKRIGIAQPSLANIEKGHSRGSKETLDMIQEAFEAESVRFSATGVYINENPITVLRGENVFLQVLDNAFYALHTRPVEEREILFAGCDDTISPPAVLESIKRLRSIDIRLRNLILEGNTEITGRLEEYRYIGADYFASRVVTVYADTVVFSDRVTDSSTSLAYICSHSAITDYHRKVFNAFWDLGEQPTITTAVKRDYV